MNSPTGKNHWLIWLGLVLATTAAGTAFVGAGLGAANGPLPVIGQIPSFTLTNQENHLISTADLRGKVWVADIIFTRCPGPCRTMTGKLQELQKAISSDAPVRFVTLTSDPENDTPAVMKKFAAQFAADPKRAETMAVDALGIYFDYSKHRATPETIKLLVGLPKPHAQMADDLQRLVRTGNELVSVAHQGGTVLLQVGDLRGLLEDGLDPVPQRDRGGPRIEEDRLGSLHSSAELRQVRSGIGQGLLPQGAGRPSGDLRGASDLHRPDGIGYFLGRHRTT